MKLLKMGGINTPGYTRITRHWVFEIKLDLTRKASFVVSVHLTHPSQAMTYIGFLLQDKVIIPITIITLNDNDVRFLILGMHILMWRQTIKYT